MYWVMSIKRKYDFRNYKENARLESRTPKRDNIMSRVLIVKQEI